MSKPIIVCFKNDEIVTAKAEIQDAVQSLLCTYCTLDWKYNVEENENEIKVKMTRIEKHKFPEHKCNNKLAPCDGKIKYYKCKD